MIQVKGVSKIYHSKQGSDIKALDQVDLLFGEKGLVFIVGNSGCGKSTLLNLLGRLDLPTSGDILLDGKSMSSFLEQEDDAYRNTYVGFVFQDFNLLEQYNVYENIALSLRLQNLKSDHSKIEKILKTVGLNDLSRREVHELSGGQKQRVAIARALVKQPKIILADEPTGNLDSDSSRQVFELLKKISEEHLVIVVSHDVEAANRYADQIIKLEDGRIVSSSSSSCEIVESNPSFQSSHLPFSYAIKMAFSHLKRRPIRLVMTVLLTAISLTLMGFAINALLFDPYQFMTTVFHDNESYVYNIRNSKVYPLGETKYLDLDEDRFKELSHLSKSPINPVYFLYDDGEIVTFQFGKNEALSKQNSYYEHVPSSFQFVEIKDDRIVGDVIGRLPHTANEIVVSKYFADYVMKFGVIDCDEQLYFPKSYQDFVSSNHKIKLGSNHLVVVGVLDDDDTLFSSSREKGKFEDRQLRDYFYDLYLTRASLIYVKGFTEEAKLVVRHESILNRMSLQNSSSHIETLLPLTTAVSSLASTGETDISHLSRNQVLLSIESLLKLDPSFQTRFDVYSSLMPGKSRETLLRELANQYLVDGKLEQLSLELTKYDVTTFSSDSTTVSVVGISLDGHDYISYDHLKEYHPIAKKCMNVQFYNDDMRLMAMVLKKFPFTYDSLNQKNPGTYYTIDMLYDAMILNVIGVYKGLWRYLLIISLLFILFTFLLYSNFLASSISNSKKEIGILRALGSRSQDVITIFGYESLSIGFLSWVLCMIFWFAAVFLLNHSLFGKLPYMIRGIITHPIVPILLLLFIILFSILITFISISRITKVKPMDAILNK